MTTCTLNPYQNTPSGEETKPNQQKTQKPKPKLNKIGSPQTKQQIFILDPDCIYIFHLQQKVGKKTQNKPNQKIQTEEVQPSHPH